MTRSHVCVGSDAGVACLGTKYMSKARGVRAVLAGVSVCLADGLAEQKYLRGGLFAGERAGERAGKRAEERA